ncbi:MAG: efflux RND transporter periplasmic adaptor subunit [Planctomycetota bacterium]
MPRVSFRRWWAPLRWVLGLLATIALLAWLMGAFGEHTPPGEPLPPLPLPAGVAVHTTALRSVPRHESAVGTVRAVRETVVAARILGRVQDLAIERAGQTVRQGQVLARLDATDLQAAVDQAVAAQAAAETRRDKARLDLERTTELVARDVAAPDRLETDQAAFRAAEAQLEQARQAANGARSALAFATVLAPIDGIVVDKDVQVGDVVLPGQPICTLYDPTRLQLVAVVREELAGVLQPGQAVEVMLDALGERCQGTVAEIVPEAQAQSRAFEVKVTGPCHPGVVSGMFGRLQVPLGERQALLVPRAAVQSVGQLDFVQVVGDDRAALRRYVRTAPAPDGATGPNGTDGELEVLSGLAPGERIVADARGR